MGIRKRRRHGRQALVRHLVQAVSEAVSGVATVVVGWASNQAEAGEAATSADAEVVMTVSMDHEAEVAPEGSGITAVACHPTEHPPDPVQAVDMEDGDTTTAGEERGTPTTSLCRREVGIVTATVAEEGEIAVAVGIVDRSGLTTAVTTMTADRGGGTDVRVQTRLEW